MRRSLMCVLGLLLALCVVPAPCAAEPDAEAPKNYSVSADYAVTSMGVGGHGATFDPTFSPHDGKTIVTDCDMGGVYVTHDEGRHWDIKNLGGRMYDIQADPLTPGRFYVAGCGLWRSDDYGDSWERIWPRDDQLRYTQLDPNQCRTYYYTSTPYAEEPGADDYPNGDLVEAVTIDPTNASHLVAMTSKYTHMTRSGNTTYKRSIFESTDGGASFTFVATYTPEKDFLKSVSDSGYSVNNHVFIEPPASTGASRIVLSSPDGVLAVDRASKKVEPLYAPGGDEILLDCARAFKDGKNHYVILETANTGVDAAALTEPTRIYLWRTANIEDPGAAEDLTPELVSSLPREYNTSLEKDESGLRTKGEAREIVAHNALGLIAPSLERMYLSYYTTESKGPSGMRSDKISGLVAYDESQPAGKRFLWEYGLRLWWKDPSYPTTPDQNMLKERANCDSSFVMLGMGADPQDPRRVAISTHATLMFSPDIDERVQYEASTNRCLVNLYPRYTTMVERNDAYSDKISNARMRSTGYEVTVAFHVKTDPFDADHLAMCMDDASLAHSYDGGETWYTYFSNRLADAKDAVLDLEFDEGREGVAYSLWHATGVGLNVPSTSGNYVGKTCRLARSDDGGEHWQAMEATGLPRDGALADLALVYPRDDEGNIVEGDRTLYVAVMGYGFYVSHDSGATFSPMNAGVATIATGGKERIWARRIVPTADGRLFGLTQYATYQGSQHDIQTANTFGNVWEWDASADGGSGSWVRLPLNSAGSVYASNWTYNGGIQARQPRDLYYDEAARTLYVAAVCCMGQSAAASQILFGGGLYAYSADAGAPVGSGAVAAIDSGSELLGNRRSLTGIGRDARGRLWLATEDGDVYVNDNVRSADDAATGWTKVASQLHRLCHGFDFATDGTVYFCTRGAAAYRIEAILPHVDDAGVAYVSYDDFGAHADGLHDDWPAIKAAHAYANERGCEVRSSVDADVAATRTYHIFKRDDADTQVVKTSVDWQGAHFVIHDEDVESLPAAVGKAHLLRFTNSPGSAVAGNQEKRDGSWVYLTPIRVDQADGDSDVVRVGRATTCLRGLSPQIDQALQTLADKGCSRALAQLTNNDKRQFIRTGIADEGQAQQDLAVVDTKTGELQNDIQWDFEQLTRVWLVGLPDQRAHVRNGTFTTLVSADQAEPASDFARGLWFRECGNLDIAGVHHTIESAGVDGAGKHDALGSHSGFVWLQYCADVTMRDCSVFAQRYRSGSHYGLLLNGCVSASFEKVVQSDGQICERGRWGVMGGNHLKDLAFDDCRLNRIDAHCGIYNLDVRGCEIGTYGIHVTGWGALNVCDTTIRADRALTLRADYGATWDGEACLSRCTQVTSGWLPPALVTPYTTLDGDGEAHDYGYDLHLPTLTVDDYLVDLSASGRDEPYLVVDNTDAGTASTRFEKARTDYWPAAMTLNDVRLVANPAKPAQAVRLTAERGGPLDEAERNYLVTSVVATMGDGGEERDITRELFWDAREVQATGPVTLSVRPNGTAANTVSVTREGRPVGGVTSVGEAWRQTFSEPGDYVVTLASKSALHGWDGSRTLAFVVPGEVRPDPAETTWRVTLNANGGTVGEGGLDSYVEGTGATLPADVTREGHAFGGWYADEALTQGPVAQIGAKETGDKEFWAKWDAAPPESERDAGRDQEGQDAREPDQKSDSGSGSGPPGKTPGRAEVTPEQTEPVQDDQGGDAGVNYAIIYHRDAVWDRSSGEGHAVVSDADYSKFVCVLVDGEELDPVRYDVESGSTRVTLHADYLAALAPGVHAVTVRSLDGEASTTFTVREKAPEPAEVPGSDETPEPAATPGPEEVPEPAAAPKPAEVAGPAAAPESEEADGQSDPAQAAPVGKKGAPVPDTADPTPGAGARVAVVALALLVGARLVGTRRG